MTIILAILGFVFGAALSGVALLLLLSGGRHMTYWATADRFPLVHAIVWFAIVAGGGVFAYLGYSLAR